MGLHKLFCIWPVVLLYTHFECKFCSLETAQVSQCITIFKVPLTSCPLTHKVGRSRHHLHQHYRKLIWSSLPEACPRCFFSLFHYHSLSWRQELRKQLVESEHACSYSLSRSGLCSPTTLLLNYDFSKTFSHRSQHRELWSHRTSEAQIKNSTTPLKQDCCQIRKQHKEKLRYPQWR